MVSGLNLREVQHIRHTRTFAPKKAVEGNINRNINSSATTVTDDNRRQRLTHLRYPSSHDGARVHHGALLPRRQPRRHRKHHPKYLAQESLHAHLLLKVFSVAFGTGRSAPSAVLISQPRNCGRVTPLAWGVCLCSSDVKQESTPT